MAFEFFFGVFGLISSSSKSRKKARLDGDWRLFSPLSANLFRDTSGKKSPASYSSSSTPDKQRGPIFSTSGTLGNANNSASESIFSSVSSSASSIASSGISGSSTGSTATLIKPQIDPVTGKKYEFMGDSGKKGSGKGSSVNTLDDMLDLDTNLRLGDDMEPGELGGGKADGEQGEGEGKGAQSRSWRVIYCRLVCLFLWLHVFRLLAGLVVEKSPLTMDFYHLGAYRLHFLIPALCLAIQVAAVSLIFNRNNDETNWLVPFYSSKDYLIRSRSNFRPKIEDYRKRVTFSICFALLLATISSFSTAAYIIHCVMQAEKLQQAVLVAAGSGSQAAAATGADGFFGISSAHLERWILMGLVVYDTLWAIYSTYICFLVSFYFNLICSIMKARFHGISKIIEDLSESNTSKTTNQARKITTVYLEHNEACELLDESNDFWQYLIFFTYFTYIPAYCYCLYNLFFVDFEAWPSFITWVIHTHTGFIILLISFSAAGVSTEIATFLHRVRGLTIGYSCYDLFAITNASMSNTAAACASYFLIVADFSRSSVFTLAQMNGTDAVGSATASSIGATATVSSVGR